MQLYLNSMTDSLTVATNASYGLVLLHLYPPHPPGIYLPDKDRLSIWPMAVVEGYFNNLALADRSLEKLRHAMETAGEWNKTWIIISADHSWRSSQKYDGHRDYRVPYLVKPAGTNEAMTCHSQFNTIVTHDFILAILRGEITSEQEAAAWLDAHQSKRMPAGFKSKYSKFNR
jgi:arylsulfatase A-like enzyme